MNSFAAFANRLVGKPDQIEARQTRRNLALHFDPARLQTQISHSLNQRDQVKTPK